MACERSQARGGIGAAAVPTQQHQIWAVSATYTAGQGNAGSLTHWAGPGIELASSWLLVEFVTMSHSGNFRYESFFFFKGSKIFIIGKQIAPRAAGRWEKRPPPRNCPIGVFLSLKDGGGGYHRGSRKMWFLPLALPSYLCQSLSDRGLRDGNVPCPISLIVSLLFSFRKLSHSG